MNERLPPLTALRAFDAAARHLSFAKAAAELNVTPAALSFQIKSLEDHLGQPVFRRMNRAVALTEAGRLLAPGAQDGFAALSQAWNAARRLTQSSVLTVTAGPAFTAKRLAPRLFAFARDHPEIELRLAATLKLLDFARDEIDVAIRFGMGNDPGLYSRPVIREWLSPMMTPALAAKLPHPRDLIHATLLHQDDTAAFDPPFDWAAWFRAANLGDAPRGGARFSQADHAMDAALAGGGVVLGRASLADQALRDGLLVTPYPLALTTEAQYRLVCQEGQEERPHIKAFLDWLTEDATQGAALCQGMRLVPAAEVAP